ncbi:AMP-binding protein [Acinetobacter radioresistens]|uniref:AMP-binding protein n=1 Tax=Acinetobacter radioresistens TaxID=40216 RepID=UPI00094655D7|nr:AMP-binding protein [Acinetobacter radioresistens]
MDMQFWDQELKNFGVNTTIQIPDRVNNLSEFLSERMNRNGAQTGLSYQGRKISFKEIDSHSQAISNGLKNLNLKKGSRIAIMLPNCLHYPMLVLGILRAGYIVVNVNPLYTLHELKNLLHDSGAEVLISMNKDFYPHLESIESLHKIFHITDLDFKLELTNIISQNNKIEDIVNLYRNIELRSDIDSEQVCLDDIAFIQYTGGTTGISKGAMLSHRNVIFNILQNASIVKGYLGDKPLDKEQYTLCILPLYHIFSLTVCLLTWGLYLGYTNVLIPNPKDISFVLQEYERNPPTLLAGVNTLFNVLVHLDKFKDLDHPNLKITIGGGSSIMEETAKKWHEITNQFIYEGYGLSETSPTLTTNLAQSNTFSGTVGLPLPLTEIVILNDQYQILGVEEEGQIAVKGPQVMSGYWNKKEETNKVFSPDGYFLTGDIGKIDRNGHIKILDRQKDMILVSGFNVYPNEVENVLMQHPAVKEVAVIGVDDAKSGQVPKAYIVKEDKQLSIEELLLHCKNYLTNYKCPKYFEFLEELPKSNVGKILRKDLR